jgi:hypothetical protein
MVKKVKLAAIIVAILLGIAGVTLVVLGLVNGFVLKRVILGVALIAAGIFAYFRINSDIEE